MIAGVNTLYWLSGGADVGRVYTFNEVDFVRYDDGRVDCSARVHISAVGSSTGALIIDGLPFANGRTVGKLANISFDNLTVPADAMDLMGIMQPGTWQIDLYWNMRSGSIQALTNASIKANSRIWFDIVYVAGPDMVGFMGDSIFRYYLEDLTPVDTINAALGGYTSAMMLPLFDRKLANKRPVKAAIMAGTNDVNNLIAASTTVSNIGAMAAQAVAKGCTPILCKIPPMGGTYAAKNPAANTLNAAIEVFATAQGYALIDLNTPFLSGGAQNAALFDPDLLHPNHAGHLIMQPIIDAALAT